MLSPNDPSKSIYQTLYAVSVYTTSSLHVVEAVDEDESQVDAVEPNQPKTQRFTSVSMNTD